MDNPVIDNTDRLIINELQGGFPVSETPFRDVANRLQMDEQILIDRITHLLDVGILSRFGPMYNVERMGGIYSLVAMKIPGHEMERVSMIVNAHPEVAHNYEREHEFNMWFVLAVESEQQKTGLLATIETGTGYPVYDMPKLDEYYIGLKFNA